MSVIKKNFITKTSSKKLDPPKENDSENDFSFIVTIPSYGRPELQSKRLLETMERHIKLSVSGRATVVPLENGKTASSK